MESTLSLRRPFRLAASALLTFSLGCSFSIECTLIGCSSGLAVMFSTPATMPYRIEASSAPGLGGSYVFDCPALPGPTCGKDEALLRDYFPGSVTIKVITALGTTTTTLSPEYTETYPNGKRCGPACRRGKVTVDLPTG